MRGWKALALLAALSLLPAAAWTLFAGRPAPAQPPSAGKPPVTFPATVPGQAAQALARIVGSDDDAAVEEFTARYLSPDLVRSGDRDWDATRYAGLLRKLRQQSGGLDAFDVRRDGDNPRYLGVLFRPRKAEGVLGIEFVESPEHPGKLSLIELHLMKPPKQPEPWPQGKLDEAALAAALEQRLRRAAEGDSFSGVALVARGDRVLVHRGYGLADRKRGVPNTADTRFNTCSVGKMFTGVAVGQLVERGKLRFEDRLIDVLPEYPNRATAEKVTLHHLLTHTSGIGDPFASPRRDPAKAYDTPWANIALFADRPLEFEPGKKHDYSNGNFAVLAAVVEKVSGQAYADYVREHVFRPAGMRAADAAAYERLPVALGYAHLPDSDPLGLEPRQAARDAKAGQPSRQMTGFGGVYLTAEDLFRFLRAVRESRLLGPAMTETVTGGKVPVMPGTPTRYGYGFYEQRLPGAVVRGHSGGGGNCGFGTHAELVWDKGYTVVLAGNYDLEYVRPLTGQILHFLAGQ